MIPWRFEISYHEEVNTTLNDSELWAYFASAFNDSTMIEWPNNLNTIKGGLSLDNEVNVTYKTGYNRTYTYVINDLMPEEFFTYEPLIHPYEGLVRVELINGTIIWSGTYYSSNPFSIFAFKSFANEFFNELRKILK